MDKNSEQGTDAAPIVCKNAASIPSLADQIHLQKPVSSLRSHFEGLTVSQSSQDDSTSSSSKPSPFALRPVDGPAATPLFRASFDLGRAGSPWPGSEVHGTDSPRTPAPKRPESPSKTNNRRPASMLAQHSPQMTPAVNVESPKSPPRSFINRSASRSPERVDSTPFAKVRDLISQHSSASSTRPPTPRTDSVDPLDDPKKPLPQAGISTNTISDTSKYAAMPPPVNRAEKPKIPIKVNTLPAQDGIANLVPENRRPSIEARVSPFNTPPSSDGSVSPTTNPGPHEYFPRKPQTDLPPLSNPRLGGEHTTLGAEQSQRSNDPRSMGFVKPAAPQERRDPRTVGFSGHEQRPPSRDPATLTRANTVSERTTHKDPRDFGVSNSARIQPRIVSENIRHTTSSASVPQQPMKPQPARDARALGFATAIAEPITEEGAPGLPPRRIVKAPPPRPPEESKNPLPKPIRQPVVGIMPDRSTKPGAVHSLPRAQTMPSEPRFLPPPKRNVEETGRPPSAQQMTPESGRSVVPPLDVPTTMVDAYDSDETEEPLDGPSTIKTDYPDATQTNRRPPTFKAGLREINVKSDSRVFDVCGQFLCTASYVTRIFDLSTGEQIMGLNHGDTVKVTAIAFKPAAQLKGEGKRLWIGNNIGEIHEIDIATHATTHTSSAHNRREIVQILRHQRDLWTLDDDGKLFVWPADESGAPNLRFSHTSHKVAKGHTFSMVVRDKLWLATGKEARVYKPGDEGSFAYLAKPLAGPGSGDITSGAYSDEQGGRVYLGRTDGKVTIYSTHDYTCVGNVKASDYKINSLSFVGDRLWAAYKTGKIYVYDTSTTPWKVKKDWRAHEGPAAGLLLDPSCVWTLGRMQVASVGHDHYVRLWDGMLEDDWVETAMHERDVQYCFFREVKAVVVTWNVGACTPSDLRGSDFIEHAVKSDDPPEIIAFGFQEVVDLEDRAMTAKNLFGLGKKKDVTNTEQHQSRVYREWRDYLNRTVNVLTRAPYSYSELHTSSLVGLFQCIFVLRDERPFIRDLYGVNVKCGLKGHYGNKGALITRLTMDDSTLCFINCHLAAGQTHTSHRNNDIATILESESLPAERDVNARMSLYIGGGDGSQILDYEVCILNGDLNYRIDTIPRDTIINMINRMELSKLLLRDQLLVSRRRVAGFRLNAFTEREITFAPTYKYDVGTGHYDSSEKKRAPAWCDRLMYRGPGRIKQLEYRRHEVRVSDHRPVSGVFKIRLKSIDAKKRQIVKDECYKSFDAVSKKVLEKASISYLVDSFGVSEKEARALLLAG